MWPFGAQTVPFSQTLNLYKSKYHLYYDKNKVLFLSNLVIEKSSQHMNFINVEPTLENYWRAIILFGKNTASYKFALAKSLIDVSLERDSDLISLEDLAFELSFTYFLRHFNY